MALVYVDPELQGIMHRYLEIQTRECAELAAAAAAGDLEKCRLLGHRMKGTGSAYGLDELTRLGRDIEEAALEKRTERVRDLSREVNAWLGGLEVRFGAAPEERGS